MASEALPPSSQTEAAAEVDLEAEIRAVQSEPGSRAQRVTRTLVGFANLKVLLVSLPAHASWEQHKTVGRISVQTLAGRIRVRALHKTFDLPRGRMLALEANVSHDVQAFEASLFLLTVVRP